MFSLIEEFLVSALVLSLVPMGAIGVVAGIAALLQTVTQVQEQSISHFARITALVLVLLWGGRCGYEELERMLVAVISRIGETRFP